MADPTWIRTTAVVSLALALPALCLLGLVWRRYKWRPVPALSAAWWVGVIFVVSYLGWFLNVTFEWSVGFMVAWPLVDILLGIVGCAWSMKAAKEDSTKLIVGNALLLVLALASIIAPN